MDIVCASCIAKFMPSQLEVADLRRLGKKPNISSLITECIQDAELAVTVGRLCAKCTCASSMC